MHHFPSRFAVIEATVDHLHEKRLREYQDLMQDIGAEGGACIRDDIRKILQLAWQYFNRPSFLAYHELLAASRTTPELSEALQRTEKDTERLFLRLFRQVLPRSENSESSQLASDLAQFCMSGLALNHMATRKQKRANCMIEFIADQLQSMYPLAEIQESSRPEEPSL